MKHLLPQKNQYKANLHAHSTISDGELTPEQLKAYYKEKGYSILSLTDHSTTVDHSHMNEPDFLMITGVEMDFRTNSAEKTCHLCMLSRAPHLLWIPFLDQEVFPHMIPYMEQCHCENLPCAYSPENINRVIAKANEKGFLVTYNHPAWSLEYYTDYAPLEGLWGMEYYNTGSYASGVDEHNGWVFREFLHMGKQLMPIMADDTHEINQSEFPCAGTAFTMVVAEKLEYSCIMDALARGDLYSSTGPTIQNLEWDDGMLRIRCSPAARIQLIKNRRATRVIWGDAVTEGEFDLRLWRQRTQNDPNAWFYLKVTDAQGNYAVTRAYTIAELCK